MGNRDTESGALRLWEAGELPFCREEILRYARFSGTITPEGLPLEACIAEVGDRIRCRCLWKIYPVKKISGPDPDKKMNPEEQFSANQDSVLDLGFVRTDNPALIRFLEGCENLVLFAMTAGLEMDRIIVRGMRQSPVRGLLLHAIGAERVETACDAFESYLAAHVTGYRSRGRFSPGYGGVSLEMQRDIFRTLECEKRLGLYLDPETLLMTPAKSVTAIVGLRKAEQD